mmetsp:Transcript_22911/g.39201  ORF Transcript_22911/g.39201 Transcript_22911/m.39201 type:complete len:208 (+) Transcript_22911:169-792(+)
MLNVGHALDGFWETGPGGPCVLNSTKTQGRMYRALDQYGPTLHALFHRLGQEVHAIACAADPSMPAVLPSTHALVLYYATQRGLGEHRDDGPNDGSSDQPVISFNLGKAVDFSVRHEKSDDKCRIRLEWGECYLVWRTLSTNIAQRCQDLSQDESSSCPRFGRRSSQFDTAIRARDFGQGRQVQILQTGTGISKKQGESIAHINQTS